MLELKLLGKVLERLLRLVEILFSPPFPQPTYPPCLIRKPLHRNSCVQRGQPQKDNRDAKAGRIESHNVTKHVPFLLPELYKVHQ